MEGKWAGGSAGSGPAKSGAICGSKLRPELEHVIPMARGGPTTAGNLRVLCGFHNTLAARNEFGGETMDQFRGGRSLMKRGATPV